MGAAMTEEWGSIGQALAHPGGRDRDVAEWQACVAVVKSLNAYAPGEFTARTSHAVSAARANRLDIDAVRAFAAANPQDFGEWRSAVTNFEASESAKLQTLVWVLRTLYRIRDRDGADTGPIDRIATIVGDFLTGRWRLDPQGIPLLSGADYRAWASKSARNYNLLPLSWRFV